MTQHDFEELKQDVADIKQALLGNEKYGNRGIIKRLVSLENWRNDVTLRLATISGLTTGLCFFAKYLITGKF